MTPGKDHRELNLLATEYLVHVPSPLGPVVRGILPDLRADLHGLLTDGDVTGAFAGETCHFGTVI